MWTLLGNLSSKIQLEEVGNQYVSDKSENGYGFWSKLAYL